MRLPLIKQFDTVKLIVIVIFVFQVFDLGKDGTKTSYVTCCYEENIVNRAAGMLR